MRVRRDHVDPGQRGGRAGVVGLDLSLRGPAACWIPEGWRGDPAKVRMGGRDWGGALTAGASPEDHAERIRRIARAVAAFCRAHRTVAVGVEGYAFGMRSTSSHALAELGGAVKLALWEELGLAAHPVAASAARKILLQRLPRRNVKEWTEENVRRLGGVAIYWTHDEVDAFTICNYQVMVQGWIPLSFEGKQVSGEHESTSADNDLASSSLSGSLARQKGTHFGNADAIVGTRRQNGR